MSKRTLDSDIKLPPLPDDCLALITRFMWQASDERAMACTLGRFAQCSKAWLNRLHGYTSRCAITEWCIVCTDRAGDTALGCDRGSRCLCRNVSGDLSEAVLCDACCLQYCERCQRGTCGCDIGFEYCARCDRARCRDCVCSELHHDDERWGSYCTDCYEQLTPESASEEDEEEEDDEL